MIASRSRSSFLCVVIALLAGLQTAVADDWERTLISEVMLLEPDDDGFVERGPLDLFIVDGQVTRIESGGTLTAAPGEMKLRGRGRWLIHAPRLAVSGLPTSDELVVAGTSGIGGLHLTEELIGAEGVWSRARMDTTALPARLGAADSAGALPVLAPDFAPTMERLVATRGDAGALLKELSTSIREPLKQPAPAAFLLLSEDPRLMPRTVLDPHAVVLGSEVILRSERLVRLEEAEAFGLLEPLPAPEPRPDPGIWTRRYELIVDGILRGEAWLEVRRFQDGRREASVRSQVAQPIDEVVQARSEWPSGRAELVMTSHGRPVRATARPAAGGQAGTLAVDFRGEPLERSPISLGPEQRFLPHTLLVLIDALSDDIDVAQVTEIIEIELLNRRPGIYQRPRPVIRQLPASKELPPFPERLISYFAQAANNQILSIAPVDAEESPSLVVLDPSGRLLNCLVPTPWGLTEWRAASRNAPIPCKDGAVDSVPDSAH